MMRMPALLLTAVAAILLVAPASPQNGANQSQKEQIQESAKRVKELQRERITTLNDLVAVTNQLFQQGRVEHNEVIDARERLFKAELDAAEKQSDRIALYQKMVDVWKRSEELAEQRAKVPRGKTLGGAPVLRFKALRLEAEIYLERAKARRE